MPRLLFEKRGTAIWISHLDLMRLFQRAFKRAGLRLKHTQGFNPRPSVSIALPLSVGVESCCELLDFELDGQEYTNEDIRDMLNNALVDGIHVIDVYNNGRKYRELALLSCQVILEYDNDIPADAVTLIEGLFRQQTLILPKKTKSGVQEQDIMPMIRNIEISAAGERTLALTACICCQNPTLNPMQLILAIKTFLPEVTPSFTKVCRLDILDQQETVFR